MIISIRKSGAYFRGSADEKPWAYSILEGQNDVNSHSPGAYFRGFNQKIRENLTTLVDT